MEEEEIFTFEKVQSQLEGLYKEAGLLSKKSPNDAINKFKLKIINQLLVVSNSLLTGDYKPLDGFDTFEEDDLPTNSDVTIILEQYLNCLEKLRGDNVEYSDFDWRWLVSGSASSHITTKPQKLKEKK